MLLSHNNPSNISFYFCVSRTPRTPGPSRHTCPSINRESSCPRSFVSLREALPPRHHRPPLAVPRCRPSPSPLKLLERHCHEKIISLPYPSSLAGKVARRSRPVVVRLVIPHHDKMHAAPHRHPCSSVDVNLQFGSSCRFASPGVPQLPCCAHHLLEIGR
jgi:hypothetical protein